MYYITSNDGIKLAVEDINKDSIKTIVLVHGWPISKEMFEYQKEDLNNLGYRVVSFDIRGFGNSDISHNNYDYDQLATDLKIIIDSLNVDKVFLLGFSMGGAICVRYMNKFNNYKVSKLILAGAAAPSFTKSINNPYGNTIDSVNSLITKGYKEKPNMMNQFANEVFALNHSDSFNSWFQGLCFKASKIGTIKAAISLRDEDVFADLNGIKVPTLIIHGKLDKICPYRFAQIMHQEIKNSILVPLDFSGHGLFYDEMDKFNFEIIKFLENSN